MKIEDICTRICSGGTPKSGKAEYYENGTIPWLNTKEINFNRIQATEAFITEEGLNNSSAKWIKPHTVIVAMYGATAGRVAVAEIPLTTNQACCNLEVDETIADYRYIYYWLKQNFDNIAGLANGGAQQNLSAKVIRQIEINLPDLIKQRSIANFLDSFDSKIEANAKLNGYLEELADSLFKRRFGGLPDNASLSDTADITMGQSPVGSSYNEDGVGTVFYQGRAEFGWRYPSQRLSTTEPKRMARCGDVLMSVRAPVGDLNIAFEDCCIGRGLAAIHSEHPSFCLYLMRSLHGKLDAFNGEGTVFGSINGRALKSLPIALPEAREIQAFEKEAFPIDALIRDNELQSRFLVALRDALLPRLMSGEIDVSKVALI